MRVVYAPADLEAIVKNQAQLDEQQKNQLLAVLTKHESIFQGKRGNWKHEEVTIHLKDDAKPYYAHPYPIPLKQLDATKHEVLRQCEIGAMRMLTVKETENNEWAFAAFGLPKKMDRSG